MLIEDGTKDTVHVSFDNKKMYASEHLHYIHPIRKEVVDTTLKVDYTYYLSDAITDNYDATKVGKTTSGKYITLHNVTSKNVDSGDFTIFEITQISNAEIFLTLCGFPSGYFNELGRKFLLRKKQ